ncbi:pyridoxamine 5'-phosphate oxidase family protein [Mycobacterium sp. 48b]|uniref:pyridoxamine 5'-phosphate oxidase family protein n=1 Tax=Mycobacterium sp. 48b TaxID=3400426 RepID=UPI003AAE0CE9
MALSKRDREGFLAEHSLVATLSVAGQQGRGPLAVPVWCQYCVGEEPWLITFAASRKVGLINAAGAFTLTVARSEPTVRYVSVEGTLGRLGETNEDQLEEVAARYLSGDALNDYLEVNRPRLDELVTVYMVPTQWNSGELGADYRQA